MACLTENHIAKLPEECDNTNYLSKGVYVYYNHYDTNKCIYHIRLVGDSIWYHENYIQPHVCFRILNDNGNMTYISLDNNDYHYEYCTDMDYFKLKKFIEIEFMKITQYSTQDNVSMQIYKQKRIELNTLIKFLDRYGPNSNQL